MQGHVLLARFLYTDMEYHIVNDTRMKSLQILDRIWYDSRMWK